MRLRIEGDIKPVQKRILIELVEWLVKEELLPDNHTGLNLTIKIDPFMINEGKDNLVGQVQCVDEEASVPCKFVVKIAAWLLQTDFMQFLCTVGHEMIHVKQWRTGEIAYCPKRKDWFYEGMVYSTLIPYCRQRWEWEAHGRGSLLTVHFCQLVGYDGHDWFRVPLN